MSEQEEVLVMETKSKKEVIIEMLDAGKTPAEIISETGYPKSSVYAVKKSHGDPEVSPLTEMLDMPSPKSAKSGKAKNVAVKPISEAKAAHIIGGIFGVVALFLGGGWTLSHDEVSILAPSLADSLALLPNPIIAAINNFSAPVILTGQVGAVIQNRLGLIALQQQQESTIPQAPRPAPIPDAEGRAVYPTPPPMPVSAPPPAPKPRVEGAPPVIVATGAQGAPNAPIQQRPGIIVPAPKTVFG